MFGVERTGPRTTTRTSGRSIVVSYGCDQRSPSGAGCKKSSRYSKLLFFPPSSSFHKDEDLKPNLGGSRTAAVTGGGGGRITGPLVRDETKLHREAPPRPQNYIEEHGRTWYLKCFHIEQCLKCFHNVPHTSILEYVCIERQRQLRPYFTSVRFCCRRGLDEDEVSTSCGVGSVRRNEKRMSER